MASSRKTLQQLWTFWAIAAVFIEFELPVFRLPIDRVEECSYRALLLSQKTSEAR